ncbi:ABC transporter permease [Aquabacter spiritensis]|uniref:NitT/TauT family transport system permease protein n=1 Tax=Aquabacter spiritensis TaxID=933073 RepID=A0A4V2UY65_9HYPH|nr:ABC transporter permease [Aquabacter spiritensis]TCT06168.1 NitT/TauT family transport system permease protein [Aquabacter spiritensis]
MSTDVKASADTPPPADTLPARAPFSIAGLIDRHLGVLSFIILMLALEFGLRYFRVPDYVLPPPSQIFTALVRGFAPPFLSPSQYYVNIATTLTEALLSFVLGSAFGIFAGAMVVEFKGVRRLALPYVIGLQSVPKVALAPLFVVWFGFGIESKVLLGVLLTFFPLLINTAAGLSSVERDRIELMASLKAKRWTTFRMVKFPSALPYVFAGLEMAAVYSILGAVVGEFVGGNSGLGVLILSRNAALDIAGSLAALVILAVMGIALQRAVAFARGRLLFWAPVHDRLDADS